MTAAHGLLLCLIALCLTACDATRNIVLENASTQTVLAGRYRFTDTGYDSIDVVSVPAGGRVQIGRAGPAGDALLKRVVLMDADCAIFADEDLSDGRHPDAILITVDADLVIDVADRSEVDAGSPPDVTDQCQAEVEDVP